ncbi:MAG TPA: bifunctional riboflavin kinase/FAD synthetase [Vicinamibacterales bacterium]
MQVAYYPDESRPLSWRHPVLALGNFDGVHRGHVKITERVRRVADERAASAVAMTFDPHPSRVIRPDKAPPLLMTTQQKLEALSKAGIQGVAIVRFTSEMSRWDPETFVRAVLVEWMRAAEVWVGANFLFGRDRSGNFSMLRSLGARYGFRAEKIDPVRYKDFVVSSTRVRRLIAEGRVDEAGALLGHHYYVDGSVIQGQRRGRQLGFPTANLCSDNELMPPAGVYATVTQIDGIFYPSVTNVGVRPTFEEANTDRGQVTVEAHLFDFEQDLYGRRLRLEFVQRLRDERRFESLDALKAQIGADCAQTRALFDSMSL